MALISSLCIFVLVAYFATPIVCHEKPYQAALFVFGDSVSILEIIITSTPLLTSKQIICRMENHSSSPLLAGSPMDASFLILSLYFAAEYANLPFIPPYFEIGKKPFVHGVNFASGGSGCLAETARGFVIDLQTQLKYFQNVAQLMKKKVGETESKQILSNAVYIFSTANNDMFAPLFANSSFPYSDREYLQMIMGNLTSVLKGIYKEGGRKFVMLNLGPLGCLPLMRALNLQIGVTNGSCMEKATNLAKMFNLALPEMLKQLEKQLPGFKYTIFNFFKVLVDSIDNPTKYGLKISESACCGTGPFRGIHSCGGKREVKEYKLCKNVKDYLFFDSAHPSELAYKKYTELLWNGTPDVVAPYNLKSFFKLST
ncbi:GDSL esterase/lipase 5-like [Solanum tuberosum]|uniref:GDSL esterase/lipase 5-like n=1 Tax=Solanum tuberosum TaxID=4113 RepID=UPI00073A26E6|nr:PREDICTED: GDSL esterase/lipase 5-like [Solanum tuberosum]